MKHQSAAVAAGHDLVADTVRDVLQAGGNAFDGAVAAAAMACAAEPVLASLGGGGFMLAHPADGARRIYDFFVQTPVRRPEETDSYDFYPVDVHFGTEVQEFHIGWGTAAVPGTVAGLFDIHRDLGRIPLAELFSPAVRAAKEGVRVNDAQASFFEIVEPIFVATEAIRAIFGSRREKGRVVRSGENLRQSEFANFLEILAIEGPALFYRGEVAAALLNEMAHRGALTAEDLAAYRVELRTPLSMSFLGTRVETNPPPSSGGLLVAFGLTLLENRPLHSLDQCGAAHAARIASVLAATSEARVESLANADRDQRPEEESAMLNPGFLETWRHRVESRISARNGTTHVSIADREGNIAALSLSNGSGSGCIIPGTGIAINNMLGEADLNPTGFHSWPRNRRLTSMMAPTVVRWPDGRVAAIGSGGSNRIRSAILQVLVNLVAHDMPAEAAVSAPRLHVEGERLSVEAGFEQEELGAVLVAWPDHRVWDRTSMFFGGAHTVLVGAGRGEAFGDFRRNGAARVF